MTQAAIKKPETNVKETIESILVAFILAFIFRCFVIEAFVIPTGSMAPTLMGAHMHFRCADCGYRFNAGFSVGNEETYAVPQNAPGDYTLFCPNCGYRLPRTLPDDTANDAQQPEVRYGDRILVMKYLYLLHDPKRFDVVVFKNPSGDDYSINYIKRLIGRPGESLFVAQGDIYVAPPGADPSVPQSYVVQTKPAAAQEALWRIVYDADYVPRQLPRTFQTARGMPGEDEKWRQPWRQTKGDGWTNADPAKNASPRTFAFDNPKGAGEISFDHTANPTKGSFTDWLAYDQAGPGGPGTTIGQGSYATDANGSMVHNVADLKIDFSVDKISEGGVVRAVLGKGETEFVAEISVDRIKLIRRSKTETLTLAEAALSPAISVSQVSFQNVDYRVAVSIDGKEILSSTPEQYAPDVQAIIDQTNNRVASPQGWARLEASATGSTISHVRLWRDVYYIDDEPRVMRATSASFPSRVLTLQADEFFVLGDNSYQSLDGRYWTADVSLPGENLYAPPGVVPARFMLGKAFFVYWPAGFRLFGTVPLIPNFGEMRAIR